MIGTSLILILYPFFLNTSTTEVIHGYVSTTAAGLLAINLTSNVTQSDHVQLGNGGNILDEGSGIRILPLSTANL